MSGCCAFGADVHDAYSATQLKLIGDLRIKRNKYIHSCSGAASFAFTILAICVQCIALIMYRMHQKLGHLVVLHLRILCH